MALDLSALEEKPTAPAGTGATEATGKPLDIPLNLIEEDPDQPRKEFTPAAMKEMADSIRERGVKTPVSVRTHPKKPNMWMLNYGARRFRGSISAGRNTIPGFIDEAHDDYDQVIENIQRDDLKPMELALFIKKRMDAGDQKQVIARSLGKDGAVITQHLALIDAPACVEDAYSSGRCTSPKTLYELRGLHEKFPEQVDAWYEEENEITRKTVSVLSDELRGNKKDKTLPEEDKQDDAEIETDSSEFGHDQIYDGNNNGPSALEGTSKEQSDFDSNADSDSDGERDGGELTSWPKGRAISDPDRMTKPLMLVIFEGRGAAVLLNRRPSAEGLIHIRFDDGGGDQEVDAGACTIDLLTDSEK